MKKEKTYARFTIDIPLELHRLLKMACASNRISMRQVVIKSIEKGLDKLKYAKKTQRYIQLKAIEHRDRERVVYADKNGLC